MERKTTRHKTHDPSQLFIGARSGMFGGEFIWGNTVEKVAHTGGIRCINCGTKRGAKGAQKGKVRGLVARGGGREPQKKKTETIVDRGDA